jgi:hypothetical protein
MDERRGFFTRVLEFLRLRKPPPDIGVREPRRPKAPTSGGVATLDLPDTDER